MAMVKVIFPFHVIHGGRIRAPHEPFEVTKEEAKALISEGAKVIENTEKQPPKPYKIPPVKKKGCPI